LFDDDEEEDEEEELLLWLAAAADWLDPASGCLSKKIKRVGTRARRTCADGEGKIGAAECAGSGGADIVL